MRWSDGDTAFGRPVRWLCALFGRETLPVEFAGLTAKNESLGHRFLSPAAFTIPEASAYTALLRERHVVVELEARRELMVDRLKTAAASAGTTLIEDAFLVEENLSLVEEPQVVVGGFEEKFLSLPERVILDVAKGHQRYFGVRRPDGKLAPHYLAVVNTALDPENVRRGNDRVMRARLADAKFFYETDLATPLGERRKALAGVVFHKRLGTVDDKVKRIEALVPALGAALGLEKQVIDTALAGARLCKCDLVTLMVGELPELQGEMGGNYALAQGTPPAVARVIAEHYQPRGADDPTAESAAGALVGLCDRMDTLAGCFGIGQIPTGAADPLALRRAALGVLRTILDKDWNLSLSTAIRAAYDGHASLDASFAETEEKLGAFLKQRLRGLLEQSLPTDAVEACLDASADRPRDVALRARALAAIDPALRASAGEVFKRAANIAKEAPDGEPRPPAEVTNDVHASEIALFDAFRELRTRVDSAQKAAEYEPALAAIAGFAPVLGKYFDDVMVMADDERVRENRLKLMRQIQRACSSIASFNLLARRPS
jgi:glycyl-tRNA synthetase beta chain